jgi:thiopeptide-type bacteriocin biosynthesis protein
MDYVCRLIEMLTRDPALRERSSYRPNSSLYRAADRFRYVEGRYVNDAREYWMVSVEATEPLENTLDRARNGANPSELAQALVADDSEFDEAREFVEELIDSQILVPDLAPFVTGPEPLGALVTELREHALHDLADPLEAARAALTALDGAELGAPPSRYDAIADLLAPLPAEVKPEQLFQVDMVKPTVESTLGKRVVREVQRSVDVLHRLSRRWEGLRAFREAFIRRYETREVPLVEALDDETGIGLPLTTGEAAAEEATPLLDGIGLPEPKNETVNWGHRDTLLMHLVFDAQRRRAREVILGAAELKALETEAPAPLAQAFSVTFTLVPQGGNGADLDSGDFRVLVHSVVGTSGAEVYGRFCHSDPRLCNEVRAHLKAEEAHRLDAVYAEIVHLPQGRLGNILLRPLLRDYEIPYLGRSAAPAGQQIAVTDLLVSVEQGRVVLRSARLGKEVLPRMTNAHGFANATNVGLYRFLCMVRYQGHAQLGWEWGPLGKAPYLPRLVAGKTVLARAQWRLTGQHLDRICEARDVERYKAVQALRRELDLPRYVLIADADLQLPVDLDNALSVEVLAHRAGKEQDVTLMEMYPEPETGVVSGPEGRFTHELSIPFVLPVSTVVSQTPSLRAQDSAVTRSFPPGSEWVFAKFYGGTETIDKVLDATAPVVKAALASGAVKRWFFVRYRDPDWHLRLRFHGEPERLQGEVLPAMYAATGPLFEDGRVWRVSLDTYEREVERYGGAEGIAFSEEIFQADSEAVLEIVQTLSGDEGLDARWRLTLRGIDMMLGDLGLDLVEKLSLVKRQRATFFRELRAESSTEQQLSDKYRIERPALDALMDVTIDEAGDLSSALEVLNARSIKIRAIGARANRVGVNVADLAASHVHMHANRLLRSAHRAQELVLYDFLTRIYESRRARLRVMQTRASGSAG